VNKTSEQGPYWTPDGKYILFEKFVDNAFTLYALPLRKGRAGGGAYPLITKKEGFNVVGLDKEGSLYLERSQPIQFGIFITELDTVTRQIKSPPRDVKSTTTGNNLFPVWSPNGKQLAYYKEDERKKGLLIIIQSSQGKKQKLKLGF
jgi:Tol biopolymer transport system component